MAVACGHMQNLGVEGRSARAAPARCVVAAGPAKAGSARAAFLAPLLLCSVLAGCSVGGEGMLFLVDPGKYQYHSCEQIAATTKGVAARQQDLAMLIERAEQGAAGAVVGTIAYKSEYTAVGQDLRLLEATARTKNCVIASTWRSNDVIQ